MVQETVTEDCAEVAEESVTKPEEETVECIDEFDQSLAEYKPQIGDQPNPFETDIPTEIDDRPVEDYIGEGEDRPGEGKTLLKLQLRARIIHTRPSSLGFVYIFPQNDCLNN